MADLFSDPNEWTDEGAVRLNFHHKRRALAENEIPPVTPCQQGNRFPPLSSDCTNPLAFIGLSGFARVEGKDGAGETMPPVRPMNRRDREGSAKRKTDFMGPLERATVKNI